ncbi:Olfactory receptor 4P4 [Heterocephalus glaber]|nr:Olfactory receptor 4P4 [Heterocephalus glaber]
MYFFLNYLALSDLCYASTVTPELVTDLLKERNTVSYASCMDQLFAMHFFGSIEVFILTAMAYDHYVAIYRPLHYVVVMSRPRCNVAVTACCSGVFLHSFVQCLLITTLHFCGPSVMDHYFCDVFPLLELACTDTHRAAILVVTNSGMMGLVVFVVVLLSYVLILYTIRAYPPESCRKALSTCSSHVMVVVLLFVPVLFIYIRPEATFPEDKVFALFYTIIDPMFNPLIYMLRNMEMKDAMRKICCQKSFLIGRHLI